MNKTTANKIRFTVARERQLKLPSNSDEKPTIKLGFKRKNYDTYVSITLWFGPTKICTTRVSGHGFNHAKDLQHDINSMLSVNQVNATVELEYIGK